MILKPDEDENDGQVTVMPPDTDLSGIGSVLASVGLGDDDDEPETEEHVQNVFKRHGGSIETIARQMSTLLVSADNDATKLRAAETLLKIYGILGRDEDEGKTKPSISITIIGTQNNSLMKVLLPT